MTSTMSRISCARQGGFLLCRLPSLRSLSFLLTRCQAKHHDNRPRNLSTNLPRRQWRNETPPGATVELYVYHPDSGTVWPDEALGVFAPIDSRFGLPGGLGLNTSSSLAESHSATQPSASLDLLTVSTHREHQAQTLHSAQDFLQNTDGIESELCLSILESFPEINGAKNLHCELRDAPKLLKREMQSMFCDRDILNNNLCVITLSQKTENDMTGWSNEVELEREKLAGDFVAAAKEICARLRNDGYWSDFIDPCSGTPYFGKHSNTTMFETDEKYSWLGFKVEDLGCCKVICHREFGRHVFVGAIFSDVHPSSGVVQDIFADMRTVLKEPTANVDNNMPIDDDGYNEAA